MIQTIIYLTPKLDQDPIILPNGLPRSCLFYADNLVLISKRAQGLQKQINILNEYCNKWLLEINLKKTKALIFQNNQHGINTPS